MNEQRYRDVFGQFLNEYWGAFHELLEAESVTSTRLADSLFSSVIEQHVRFTEVCPATLKPAMDALSLLWRRLTDHRVIVPDEPLTPEQIHEALGHFREIHDRLFVAGRVFPKTRTDVLIHARHSHPRARLRADAAS